MGILDDITGKTASRLEAKIEDLEQEKNDLEELNAHYGIGTLLFTTGFDGEKTPGEIGVIKDYVPDYQRLRARSWQLYLESDISQLVIKKFVLWMIGSGLKLQAEPLKDVLEELGIKTDHSKVKKSIESRFKLFAKSERSSYSGNQSLNAIASEARKNAYLSGDCLVIQRFEEKQQTVQLIDGGNIATPFGSSKHRDRSTKNGNRIIDGVEVDSKGTHVAFYVKKSNSRDYQRIAARDKHGRKLAFLVYGLKHKINDTRGLPLITAVMESIKKLDRYKEATVGSAEERQKISWYVTHNESSTGANPLKAHLQSTLSGTTASKASTAVQYPVDAPENIALTSNKSVFNLENGSDIKSLDSDNELSFKEFYMTNIEVICASLGVSSEVALSKFEGSYSSSRAAIKDWEHSLNIGREEFSNEFYKPIYELWLDINVLQNNIQLNGYKQALMNNDYYVLDSYRNARWSGSSVPHIDPLKEVNAERAKLGDQAKHLPLTSLEQATENVMGGDSESNMVSFQEALSVMPVPKIEPKVEEVEKPSKKNDKKDND